jgi:hypothetical protein
MITCAEEHRPDKGSICSVSPNSQGECGADYPFRLEVSKVAPSFDLAEILFTVLRSLVQSLRHSQISKQEP